MASEKMRYFKKKTGLARRIPPIKEKQVPLFQTKLYPTKKYLRP
jgi:hypothetical protein